MPATLPRRFAQRTSHVVALSLTVLSLVSTSLAQARPGHTHVHGEARLEVMLDGQSLVLELVVPMEALVGFERAPRTPAERAQIAQAVERLGQSTLLRPDRAGQCEMLAPKIALPPVMTETATATTADEHVDLQARFEFRCQQPAALAQLELGLFDAFSRLRRIQTRVVDLRGQSAQTLTRANRVVRLNARP